MSDKILFGIELITLCLSSILMVSVYLSEFRTGSIIMGCISALNALSLLRTEYYGLLFSYIRVLQLLLLVAFIYVIMLVTLTETPLTAIFVMYLNLQVIGLICVISTQNTLVHTVEQVWTGVPCYLDCKWDWDPRTRNKLICPIILWMHWPYWALGQSLKSC